MTQQIHLDSLSLCKNRHGKTHNNKKNCNNPKCAIMKRREVENWEEDWELEACRSASLSYSAVNNRNLSNKVRRKINTLGFVPSSSFLILIIMRFIFWRGPYILPESGWVLLWYLCHYCAGEYVLSRWSIRTLKKIYEQNRGEIWDIMRRQ